MDQVQSAADRPKVQPRRVRRPHDKDALFRLLRDNEVFETLRDTIAFAAALGFQKDMRIPFKDSSEPVPWSYFADAGYEALVNMIAGVSTGDFKVLASDRIEERISIFEEYANGGLTFLDGLLFRNGDPTLDKICDVIMENDVRPQAMTETSLPEDLTW